MSEAREVARRSIGGMAAVWSVSGVKLAVAFASMPILLRLVGDEAIGGFAYVALLHEGLGMLRSLRGGEYLVRLRDGDLERAWPTVFAVDLAAGATLAAASFAFAAPILEAAGAAHLAPFFQVLAAQYLLHALGIPGSFLQRQLSFWRLQVPQLAGAFLRPALKIAFAWQGWGILALVAGDVLGFAAEMAILWVVARVRPRFAFDRTVARDLVRFGGPLIFAQYLTFFCWRIDDVYVFHLLGQRDLGWYWLAFRIPEFVFNLKIAISPVAYAALSRLGDRERRRAGFEALTRYTFVATAPIAIVSTLHGGEWIVLLFGREFESSVVPFRILMATACLRMTIGYSADLLLIAGKTRVLLWITFSNSVAIGIGGFFLTLRYDLPGTAVAVALMIVSSVPSSVIVARGLVGARYLPVLGRSAAVLAAVLAAGWAWRACGPDAGFVAPSIAWPLVYLALVARFEPAVRRDWRFLRRPRAPGA